MSVDEMRASWARMQESVDQLYDLVSPDLRAGSPADPVRFQQIPDLLDSALLASEQVRLGASRVLAQAGGDQHTEVVRLLLAAAAVDAMLACDIASLDPEFVGVPTPEGLVEEGEEDPGAVDADRNDTLREARAMFAGGFRSIGGAQPDPDREALAADVVGCIDKLIHLATGPTRTLVGGMSAAAGGAVFEYGASFIHVDLASHLDDAVRSVASRAPRFLREYGRKLITLRTDEWIVDEIGHELASHPVSNAVLGRIAAADTARVRASQRIASAADVTPDQIEALRADLAKLADAYSTECGLIQRAAKWLRRAATPLVHLIGPPIGSAGLAGVFFLGTAYVAYSLTDRIDSRNLGFADRVEGVVKLVDKDLRKTDLATGADADNPVPSSDGGLRRILGVVAWIGGAVAYVWIVGWVFAVVGFAGARLPALEAVDQLSFGAIFSHGAVSTLLMLAVAAAGGLLAIFSSARKWAVHGPDWRDVVNRGVAKAAAAPGAKQARAQRERAASEERGRRRRQRFRAIASRAGRWKRRLRPEPEAAHGLRGRPLALLANGLAFVQGRAQGRAATLPPGRPARRAWLTDWPVRVVAGFNIMLLSAVLAIGLAKLIGEWFPVPPWASLADWVGVFVALAAFFAFRWLLTIASPLALPAWAHGLVWGVIGVATLFASFPLGLLVLSGVGIATLGRRLASLPQPHTASEFARSPLLGVLLGITTLLGIAYSATPPVPLPQVVLSTQTSVLTGGYVSGGSRGVYLATCTGLADATSTDERLQFVPTEEIRAVRIGGGSYYLDSGRRPSIARLVLHALGLGASPPTLFSAPLRAQHPTCAGQNLQKPTVGALDPALGAGVIAGPQDAPPRASDGEIPIQDDGKTPRDIVELARMYQPTLLVTAADRNWPVSVNAVLAERGPKGQPVCLIRFYRVHRAQPQRDRWRRTNKCGPTAADLTPNGASLRDYLQLPVFLGGNRSPDGQFQAFLKGQYQLSGPLHQWLADPSPLDPWHSAEIYFYYAGPITSSRWPENAEDPNVPDGLIGLEYWFYYPYNYYPLVVNSSLMNPAPIAGDLANNDLHQGDWEHVDVLLNPADDKPAWLYMARHADEGTFVPWSSPALQLDGTHPVIQAAFGGHPSYLPGCGAPPRPKINYLSNDWLSCGSGRFAFRATTTPLVNIQDMPWACWPGYFGEATPLEVSHSTSTNPSFTESVIENIKHFLYAVSPRAPLNQQENTEQGKPLVCRSDVPRSAYPPVSRTPTHP